MNLYGIFLQQWQAPDHGEKLVPLDRANLLKAKRRAVSAPSAALGMPHCPLGLRLGLSVTPWPWVGGLPTYATHHRALGLGFTLFGLPQK